jgi:hypothetical protein
LYSPTAVFRSFVVSALFGDKTALGSRSASKADLSLLYDMSLFIEAASAGAALPVTSQMGERPAAVTTLAIERHKGTLHVSLQKLQQSSHTRGDVVAAINADCRALISLAGKADHKGMAEAGAALFSVLAAGLRPTDVLEAGLLSDCAEFINSCLTSRRPGAYSDRFGLVHRAGGANKVADVLIATWSAGIPTAKMGARMLLLAAWKGLCSDIESLSEIAAKEGLWHALAGAVRLYHEEDLASGGELIGLCATLMGGIATVSSRETYSCFAPDISNLLEKLLIERSHTLDTPQAAAVVNALDSIRSPMPMLGLPVAALDEKNLLEALLLMLGRFSIRSVAFGSVIHLLTGLASAIVSRQYITNDTFNTSIGHLKKLLGGLASVFAPVAIVGHWSSLLPVCDILKMLVKTSERSADLHQALEDEPGLVQFALDAFAWDQNEGPALAICSQLTELAWDLGRSSLRRKQALLKGGTVALSTACLLRCVSGDLDTNEKWLVVSSLDFVEKVVKEDTSGEAIRQFVKGGGLRVLRPFIEEEMITSKIPAILQALSSTITRKEAKEEPWKRRRHLCIDRHKSHAMAKAGLDWTRDRKKDGDNSQTVGEAVTAAGAAGAGEQRKGPA